METSFFLAIFFSKCPFENASTDFYDFINVPRVSFLSE